MKAASLCAPSAAMSCAMGNPVLRTEFPSMRPSSPVQSPSGFNAFVVFCFRDCR
jgi:hypothetical protein